MHSSLHRLSHFFVLFLIVCLATLPSYYAQDVEGTAADPLINLKTVGSVTDDEVVQREEEAMSTTGYSVAEKRLLETGAKHQFQAEVSRLMSLIVNSLYSNKDVFLRELISNASDALDKIRFHSLTDVSALDTGSTFEIRIQPDPENKQLIITDTGVGMTKEDLIKNLGTIAKSGTSDFIAQAEQGDTSNLIGQFGVGFYSAFLAAERVTVISKNNADDQYIWSSDSEGEFIIGEDPEGNTLGRGTKIILHLRDDSLGYLNQSTLRGLVARYSEFINFPIYLYESHIEETEIHNEPEDDFQETEEGEGEEEGEDDWDYEVVEETVWDWTLLNDVKPIWTRPASEITDEEYIAFYKNGLSKSDDVEDPYSWIHFSAEGDLEFKAILFMPQEVPQDQFGATRARDTNDNKGIRLYVRRVYITDEFDTVIPRYLGFIKGIVDSSSLPLNVSREILQQDKSLRLMQKKLVRKAIAMIQKLAIEDEEKYLDFYEDYQVNLKFGIMEDRPNADRLTKLLRFESTKSNNEMISLDQYIENIDEDEEFKQIFYIAGESKKQLENSPLLERLIAADREVLYMTDPIDEYWTQQHTTYENIKFVNVAKDIDLKLDEEEVSEAVTEEFQPLVDFFKSTLGSKISKAKLSKRLVTTPSALVANAFGYSANMERIQRAQTLQMGADPFMSTRKVLELNPTHDLVKQLLDLVTEDAESQLAIDMAQLLFDTAALHSGFTLDDTSAFAKSIHRMMASSLPAATEFASHDEL